jgi:ubiquinone/menaquinone biosynthesis C-methylase UbiE
MVHNNKEVLDYWNQENTESMYDKHLLENEIRLIRQQLRPGSRILDAGCGEGEGTLEYASIENCTIHAVDFSETRLKKAGERLRNLSGITLKKVDFLGDYSLEGNYDFIISQRFLINLMEWKLQQKVLSDFYALLRPGGKFLMLEGSIQGVEELNQARKIYNLPEIPVKWHNLFFNDNVLEQFMADKGFNLSLKTGLGTYFFLTRCIRPCFDKDLSWDSEFNRISSGQDLSHMLDLGGKFSRLKLWVFEKR